MSDAFEKIHAAGVERHPEAWFETNMLAVSKASYYGLHAERDKTAISAVVLAVLDAAKRYYGSPSYVPHAGGGIYVASRVKHAELWKQYRAAGTPIIASWIDEAGEGETGDFGELWQRIRAEIGNSKGLVFYAAGVEDFPVKGALVEVGIALAMGKPVFVVLNNVMLEGRTLRPVGSWLRDRNVHLYEDLDDALIAASLGRRDISGSGS